MTNWDLCYRWRSDAERPTAVPLYDSGRHEVLGRRLAQDRRDSRWARGPLARFYRWAAQYNIILWQMMVVIELCPCSGVHLNSTRNKSLNTRFSFIETLFTHLECFSTILWYIISYHINWIKSFNFTYYWHHRRVQDFNSGGSKIGFRGPGSM